MGQFSVPVGDRTVAFGQWQLKEAVELEHQREELKEERRRLEAERREFEQEKREFYLGRRVEEQRAEQEKKLFDMKWKVLEGELKKLAAEKAQVERQRDFYRYVSEFGAEPQTQVVHGEMFFCGVDSEESLRKRYKDLIKIYHPDNMNGDNSTIQEINAEYEKLKALYE